MASYPQEDSVKMCKLSDLRVCTLLCDKSGHCTGVSASSALVTDASSPVFEIPAVYVKEEPSDEMEVISVKEEPFLYGYELPLSESTSHDSSGQTAPFPLPSVPCKTEPQLPTQDAHQCSEQYNDSSLTKLTLDADKLIKNRSECVGTGLESIMHENSLIDGLSTKDSWHSVKASPPKSSRISTRKRKAASIMHQNLLIDAPSTEGKRHSVKASPPKSSRISTRKRKAAFNSNTSNVGPLPVKKKCCRRINERTKHQPEKPISLPHKTVESNMKLEAPSTSSHVSAWNAFISDDMVTAIVDATNIKIKPKIIETVNKKELYYIRYTDSEEIKAFIGLCYMRGALGITHLNAQLLFSEVVGPPIFVTTMSANRFGFLLDNICFDDINTRADRLPFDKFAAMRDVFEMFNRNCGSALDLCDYLSLNETVYPCRTVLGQETPSKPAQPCLHFQSINSAKFPYTYQTFVPCGKPEKTPAPYHTQGSVAIAKRLIDDLGKYSNLESVNIIIYGLNPNVELCEWLLNKKINVLKTTLPNHKNNKTTFLQKREGFSYNLITLKTNKKPSFHSQVASVKAWNDQGEQLPSTPCRLESATADDQDRKKDVEIVGTRIRSYSTNTKPKRWTLSVLSYMLDTARANAQVLWERNEHKSPNSTNSFKFLFQLATDLVHDHISKQNKNYLTSITQKIAAYLSVHSESHTSELSETEALTAASLSRGVEPGNSIAATDATFSDSPATNVTTPVTRKRCFKCVEEKCRIMVAEERKKKQAAMSRVTTACKMCHKAVCKQHFEPICVDCSLTNK
ncbi:uncharacterized protein LOC108676889 isoform X2 [Hyalella azteca]|nr:uncharacterized protein LOC108676889 isoform X2 [Hyalella azteca]XP_047737122.1 uncharacterized protein LOC108676889 isoform X2 [Hyalella azteca]